MYRQYKIGCIITFFLIAAVLVFSSFKIGGVGDNSITALAVAEADFGIVNPLPSWGWMTLVGIIVAAIIVGIFLRYNEPKHVKYEDETPIDEPDMEFGMTKL